MNPSILKRVKKLGVVLALHSYVYEHGDKMQDYGPKRWPMMHPNRSALDLGIPVAGNSDSPVSAAYPLLRIQSLVTRRSAEGKVYHPKQLRCINQAKRGMLALNVEWLGMGQLRTDRFHHARSNQLDLCGTSGLAPFVLSMIRSLDILLGLEHTDPERMIQLIQPMLGEQRVVQRPAPAAKPGKPAPPAPPPIVMRTNTTAVMTPLPQMKSILIKANADFSILWICYL